MKTRVCLKLCFVAAFLLAGAARGDGAGTGPGLPVYQPDVTYSIVHPARPAWNIDWGYNHDSDIVVYRGRYICVWNGNAHSDYESDNGQRNYISVSDDFEHWSRPAPAFGRDNGAVNPVEDSLREWQPNFINYHDKKLFCNWKSDRRGARWSHWVSVSKDGLHWTNRELPNQVEGFEDNRAFPTTHGLLTHDDILLFPVSLRNTKDVRETRFGVALRSEDGGATWAFGEPFEAVTLSEIGEDPNDYDGRDIISLWEPVFFEHAGGRIGCIIRHMVQKKTVLDERGKPRTVSFGPKPEHAILYAESADQGRTFTKARPIEVESVSSRELAISGVGTPDGLIMAADDWPSGLPDFARNRQNLSLFVSPTGDPNLLLPGPLVQRRGGQAHYPNGCIHNDALYLSYSHGTNPVRGIYATRTEPLPDFSRPFLMPRGRGPEIEFYDGKAYLSDASACLGLVLTKELTEADTLRLRFRASIECVDHYNLLPLLTAGGKTRNDLLVYVDLKCNVYVQSGGEKRKLGRIPLNVWFQFEVVLGPDACSVACQGLAKRELPTRVLRKLCFGGLYYPPTVEPMNTAFHIDLERIELEAL